MDNKDEIISLQQDIIADQLRQNIRNMAFDIWGVPTSGSVTPRQPEGGAPSGPAPKGPAPKNPSPAARAYARRVVTALCRRETGVLGANPHEAAQLRALSNKLIAMTESW